jgi:hypothetical protein
MAAPKPNPATVAISDHIARTFRIRMPISASPQTFGFRIRYGKTTAKQMVPPAFP